MAFWMPCFCSAQRNGPESHGSTLSPTSDNLLFIKYSKQGRNLKHLRPFGTPLSRDKLFRGKLEATTREITISLPVPQNEQKGCQGGVLKCMFFANFSRYQQRWNALPRRREANKPKFLPFFYDRALNGISALRKTNTFPEVTPAKVIVKHTRRVHRD